MQTVRFPHPSIKPKLTRERVIEIPFPTAFLAESARRAISADKELSSLVTRSFEISSENKTILTVRYAAATNRMLRVAVNGFFETLGVVVQCMEELDVDVISGPIKESLAGVQGLEDGHGL
jgi:EKC/KEOPS complex subunit PCC1/LAGE3